MSGGRMATNISLTSQAPLMLGRLTHELDWSTNSPRVFPAWNLLWNFRFMAGECSDRPRIGDSDRSSAHEGLATDMHFAITGISKVRDAAARNCVCTDRKSTRLNSSH